MIKIEYPPYAFKTKNEGNNTLIFDPVRKLWLLLTPEEWVRQNFIQYLLQSKSYPASLLAIEKEIRLGELVKRCDIVLYNPQGQPLLMVECKSMDIELDRKTLDQVLRYNISLQVSYLVITNGTYCYGFRKSDDKLEMIQEIPDWPLPDPG